VSGRGLAGSASTILDGLAAITLASPAAVAEGQNLASAAQRTAQRGGRTAVAVLGPGALGELPALAPLRQNWATVLAAVVDRGVRAADPGVAVLFGADAAELSVAWNQRWS